METLDSPDACCETTLLLPERLMQAFMGIAPLQRGDEIDSGFLTSDSSFRKPITDRSPLSALDFSSTGRLPLPNGINNKYGVFGNIYYGGP